MADEAPTLTGTVKFYSDDGGYGFITAWDKSDVFFHIHTVAVQSLEPEKGDRVTYNESRDKNGRPCAVNVVVME
jgi:cold shock CspA family protein